MPSIRTTTVATAIMMLPLPDLALASNWQSSLLIPTTVEYDSNPLLLNSDEKGVMRTLIEPHYTLLGTFERDQLTLGLGVNVLRSSDRSVQDNREDPDLNLGWRREFERGHFGLNARYLETSTLSGNVLDAAVVTTDGTQKLSTLSADWAYAVSARHTLANETRYWHATYDVATLTGYDEWDNTSTWTYAWSERTEVYGDFRLRRYEPRQTDSASASSSYTPGVGVKYQFSEVLTGFVHLGINRVTGSEGGQRGEGGLALDYQGPRAEAGVSAERTTLASSEGGFAQVDLLRGTWSYAVSERDRVGLDLQWQDSKGQSPNTLHTYAAWASRQLSPAWDLRLSLMHKRREQDSAADAVATIVGLSLTYRFPDI